MFNIEGSFPANSTGWRDTTVYVGGNYFRGQRSATAGAATHHSLFPSGYWGAGVRIEVKVQQTSGAAMNCSCYLSGVYIPLV